MPMAKTATEDFKKLLVAYKAKKIEFPQLKAVTFAQWTLECGWGTTPLALRHKNYAGAKWRPYMADWATSVIYSAHDGTEYYCSFATHDKWIEGYWGRLDKEKAYKGWRQHVKNGTEFINFIGPTWVGTGAIGEAVYVRHVLRLMEQQADLFKEDPNEKVPIVNPDDMRTHAWGSMRSDSELQRNGDE